MEINKHFSDQALNDIIGEIKRRHEGGYLKVVNNIVSQISSYYMQKKTSAKFVLGISGGIDSTVAAYLTKQAVGSENMILLYIPAIDNNDDNKYFEDVKSCIGAKDIFAISIIDVSRKMEENVEKVVGHKLNAINVGNIASRLRVNMFYAVAREYDGFVLGTSNRTEFVQGYATKYGTPISCDFGILDDLYKTDIIEIASMINIPRRILERKPTTGFYLGQTHEDELNATMQEQDCAAYLLFEKNMSVGEINQRYSVSQQYLGDFIERYKDSFHKRKLQAEHVRLGLIVNNDI